MIKVNNLYKLIVVFLIAGASFGLSTQTDNAKASSYDEICNTWSEISKECLSIPVNCLCPIIIEPDQ